jgi:hypothetical protein
MKNAEHLFRVQSGVEPRPTSVQLAANPLHLPQHIVFVCFMLLSHYTDVVVFGGMKTDYVLCEVGIKKNII